MAKILGFSIIAVGDTFILHSAFCILHFALFQFIAHQCDKLEFVLVKMADMMYNNK